MANLTKRAFDERLFDVNLAPVLRSGDTIASIDNPIIASDDLTISDVTHDATVARMKIAGGEAGQIYPILIRLTTSSMPPQRIEAKINLVVDSG